MGLTKVFFLVLFCLVALVFAKHGGSSSEHTSSASSDDDVSSTSGSASTTTAHGHHSVVQNTEIGPSTVTSHLPTGRVFNTDNTRNRHEESIRRRDRPNTFYHAPVRNEVTQPPLTPPEHTLKTKGRKEVLAFNEPFNDFDLSVWEHEITMGGGGNWEFQYYTNNRSNSYVKNGVLYLKPTLTAESIGEENLHSGFTMDLWGSNPANLCTGNQFYGCSRTSGMGGNILNPIQSARVRTAKSFNFKYGRLEITAKLPSGNWLWPAIWLLPRYNYYGEWPASGEVDIMEAKGNSPAYKGEGSDYFYSTLHWGPDWLHNEYMKTHGVFKLPNGSLADDFHIYGMYWDNDELYTYIDYPENVVLRVPFNESFWTRGGWNNKTQDNPWKNRGNGAPFDQEFYLIMNVAVGGVSDFFPDGVDGKPWNVNEPHAMNSFYAAKDEWLPTWCPKSNPDGCALQIDSVKFWKFEDSSDLQ